MSWTRQPHFVPALTIPGAPTAPYRRTLHSRPAAWKVVDMPLLQIIISSTRPGRLGPVVADWFTDRVKDYGGFAVQCVDLAEVGLPFLDEPAHPSERAYTRAHTKAWSATVDQADAFVFVMCEYNAGFNAPLKNALDFLYHEWAHKPVGFVSYGGTAAGTRAVQMIKPVLTTLRMYPLNAAVAIPVRDRLDPEGGLRPNDTMDAAATAMLDELTRLTAVLATLRAAPVAT